MFIPELFFLFFDIPICKFSHSACEMAKDFGYDGLELACWGDHMDVEQAAKDKKYCEDKHKLLDKFGLKLWAISNHLAGQLVCDPNDDSRSDGFASRPA